MLCCQIQTFLLAGPEQPTLLLNNCSRPLPPDPRPTLWGRQFSPAGIPALSGPINRVNNYAPSKRIRRAPLQTVLWFGHALKMQLVG